MPARLQRTLTTTPLRATVLRYAAALGTVAAVVWIIPQTPLEGPIGGIVAVATILACAWFGGVGPALMFPSLVFLLSRLSQSDPRPLADFTSRELITFGVFTVLTAAVGLAGQYRRRIRAVTQRHSERMREQARVWSVAHVVFRDVEGRVTQWNEGAECMFGWTSAEAEGRLLHDLLQTQFPQPLAVIQIELNGAGQWEGEVVHRRRDGQELTVATHWILYRNAAGTPVGVAEIHNDVSALRRAEEAIRESDRRKDRFLATLAHELRNPLAPLRSGLDMLSLSGERSPVDEEIHELMGRQVEHMVHLIDDLMDVSRINTGKIVLQRTTVALAEIVRDAVDGARPHIDAAQHELTIDQPSQPLYLHADRARVTQVLMNLLNNAAKFTPPTGSIALSVTRENDDAVIRVRDNGIGISPEMLPHVFDLFAQSGDLLVRAHGGLGIGLSIARTLVELHDGTIDAQSEGPGCGSEFVVRLPQAVPATNDLCGPGLPVRIRGAATNRRVLVVDDNRDAAQTLAMLLTNLGCECQSAFDGPSALEIAGSFQPDAFVLDIGLPGMCGYEVAKRLRAMPQHDGAVLIAVTGWGKEEDRRYARDAGFDHHLVKPVQIKALFELLKVCEPSKV